MIVVRRAIQSPCENCLNYEATLSGYEQIQMRWSGLMIAEQLTFSAGRERNSFSAIKRKKRRNSTQP
jgi:hypothetical protein